MKTVVVISVSRAVGETFVAQIRRFFQDAVPVVRYCLHEPFEFAPAEVIAVITGQHALANEKVQALIAGGMDYLLARRSIDYTCIRDLLVLPAGLEVLLVNDYQSTTHDAIEHLNRIGLDHLVYHPYYPGLKDYPELETAVTPGEVALVPACVRHTINIGTRHADISTIMELVQRLGLMDRLGDSISSQHLQEITRLLREIEGAGKRVAQMRDTLQVLADYAPNGILYTDLAGRVILGNQTMAKVLRLTPEAMINRTVAELVPGLAPGADTPEASSIVALGGQDLVVRQQAVLQGPAVVGHIYTFETSHTIQTLEYELRRKSRMAEHEARYTFADIISASPEMERLLGFARQIAQNDSTILIQGESGTGKELVAQAIHNVSRRRAGSFVPVNFAAFPASLLESELFGYEEGAFTGARKGGMRGLFAEAHGGTIFLDEIGDAPLEFQVRLLRVLQERQVRPVGGRKLIPIDVRVIAATNKNLVAEVRKGTFREDLYYRLSVLPLRMPSLRERREDIPLLFDEFVRRFSHGRYARAGDVLSRETLEHLYDYAWPGNIRQLMNAVEYLLNIQEGHRLLPPSHLPEYLQGATGPSETHLVQEVLGEDLLWVLRKLREYGSIGRQHLAELAQAERSGLSEARIRGLLLTTESLGFTQSGKGRKGAMLTDKGRLVAGG